MKAFKMSLLVGVVFALSPVASAQPSDARYCQALIDTYLRYIGVGGESRVGDGRSPNVIYTSAIEQCRAGNTGAGIPVLEKALTNAKFTLPPRG